jgi:hypothetical protein
LTPKYCKWSVLSNFLDSGQPHWNIVILLAIGNIRTGSLELQNSKGKSTTLSALDSKSYWPTVLVAGKPYLDLWLPKEFWWKNSPRIPCKLLFTHKTFSFLTVGVNECTSECPHEWQRAKQYTKICILAVSVTFLDTGKSKSWCWLK